MGMQSDPLESVKDGLEMDPHNEELQTILKELEKEISGGANGDVQLPR